jgi:hypothetical protein
MIADIVAGVFERIGHTWKTDQGLIVPSEQDVEIFLDNAASALYTYSEGDRFESGGLIIERTKRGHDVWVYVGNYE